MGQRRLTTASLTRLLLSVVPALAVLVGLGTWQLQRMAWKEDLIARIATRVSEAPRPFVDLEKQEAGSLEYFRVSVRGTFRHDAEQYLWTPDPRHGPGYHVYTPLRMDDGRYILVNRGYVPEVRKAPSSRPQGQPSGVTEVIGLVREPVERGWFAPDRRPSSAVWYWRDLEGMLAAALGADAGKAVRYVIDAEAEPLNPGGWPLGGTTRLTLPNRHLEYALTWYGLALTLIIVVIAYVVPRWRSAD